MLFFDNIAFLGILGFSVIFLLVRSFSSSQGILNCLLLLGNVMIVNLVTGLSSIAIISMAALVTYGFGVFASRSRQAGLYTPLFIGVLIILFAARNYHLAGVAVIERMGLSYVLFRLIHFVVDCRNHKIANHDPLSFLNYILFFPTFLAGPIDQYSHFRYWLSQPRKTYSISLFKAGTFRIALGVVKKYLIVDQLTTYAVDFSAYNQQGAWQAHFLISLVVFSFYILLDFSGYSDIAIGTAYLIGIKTPENFNRPYLAANLADFWRRWHMTFSRFLFRYIFYPLVTSLSAAYASSPRLLITAIGYLFTFLVCGLWHGTTSNFIYWGLWHAAGLILYKYWQTHISPSIPDRVTLKKQKFNTAFSTLITFLFVTAGWFLFTYDSQEISLITRNFFKSRNAASMEIIEYEDAAGFKINFTPPVSHDTTVVVQLKSVARKTLRTVPFRRNSENTYYVIPEHQAPDLFLLKVFSGTDSVGGQQLLYLNRHKEKQSALQKLLFGPVPKSQQILPNPKNFVSFKDRLYLPYSYDIYGPKATPLFFDGYGQGISVSLTANPECLLEVWYQRDNDPWKLYVGDRPGEHNFVHIHGDMFYNGLNRNLYPGRYTILLRYVQGQLKSRWFETSTTIPPYTP